MLRAIILLAAIDALLYAAPRVRLVPIAPGHARNSINATIFCHPAATHGDTQYVAFYDAAGFVVLAKRRLGGTNWETRRTEFQGNIKDAHNGISIAVDGNGRLHMSWDHHGHPLRYVRSIRPGAIELTSKMPMDGLKENRVTYPEFFNLPGGDLLFLYRDGASGRGDSILKRYHVRSGKWSTVQELLIDGQGGRNAYTNQVVIDGQGNWHLSWCWRERGDASTNHDICYAVSADQGKTWKKSNGEVYHLPITVDTAEIAHTVPLKSDLINTTTMAVDSQGRPRIATYFRPPGAAAPQYHIIWFGGSAWHASQIGNHKGSWSLSGGGTRSIPMSRPLILIDRKDTTHVIFRDDELGGRVTRAYTASLRPPAWRFESLTEENLDRWEPTCDRALWERLGVLHLFYQRVGQGDGEQWADLPPQMVSILEWQP
jgi:hypothetical protein